MQLTVQKYFLESISEIRDKIVLLTKRIFLSKEKPEDAVEEDILKLWQVYPDQLDGFKSLEAYTIRMAKNYWFDRLLEKDHLIIQLREIEQYDFNEIALILNLPEGTLRVFLSVIRKKLRKQFIEIQNHGN